MRVNGDWEGWTAFFLECIRSSAEDGVATARALFTRVNEDRRKVVMSKLSTMVAVRLFDLLPTHPTVTLPRSIELLQTSKPTAAKAIDALLKADVLHEISGRRRDRVYTYKAYLDLLAKDTLLAER